MSSKQNGKKFFYGWFIAIGTCIIVCLLIGVRNSYGVFFTLIEQDFSLTRATTSSIFSSFLIITSAFGLVNGMALDRFGPRVVFSFFGFITGLGLLLTSQVNAFWQMFITYSLLLAIGQGGIIPLAASTASHWFEKHRGIAIAIATSGAGLGSLVISPLAGYLISVMEWRAAYFTLGIIVLALVMGIAFFMRKSPRDIGLMPYGHNTSSEADIHTSIAEHSPTPGLTLTQALRTGNFWLLVAYSFFYAVATFMLITHIVPCAVDNGIPNVQASTILSCLGGVAIAARLIAGRIADLIGMKKPLMLYALIGGLAFILLITAEKIWAFYLVSIGFGICWGGFGVTMLALGVHIFGNRNIGAILGTSDMAYAVGSSIGAALGGYIFDIRSSYDMAFAIGAICLIITIPLVALTRSKSAVQTT